MLALCLLYALFGITFILAKQVVSIVPPIFFIALRMVIAGSILLLYLLVTNQLKKNIITQKSIPLLLGIIVFHIYGAYVLEFIGLQYLSGAYVSLLYNLTPFVTGLFSYFLLKERLTITQWISLICGFLSFCPLVFMHTMCNFNLNFNVFYPYIFIFFAIVSACMGWILMKKIMNMHNYSYIFINGIGMFFGGLIAGVHASCVEILPNIIILFSNVKFLFLLFLLICIGNIICYNLYGFLLKYYSNTVISFFGMTVPFFTAFFEWILYKQNVEFLFLITGLCTGISLYVFYKNELNKIKN